MLERRMTGPTVHKVARWGLVFGLKQHGASLATLLRRVNGLEPTLLLVRDRYLACAARNLHAEMGRR